MSLLFATALIASAAPTVPNCSWDRPGVNPFVGNVVESVDRYSDIPADVRTRLKQRMAARQYDELVTIKRDAIVGRDHYDPQIRDMHFGAGRVCRTVSRSRWRADSQERGLVYCDSGQCLLVPTVCRNLSRITRRETAAGGAPGPLAPLPPGGYGGGAPGLFGGTGAVGPLGDPPAGGAGTRGLQVASAGGIGGLVGGGDAAFADGTAVAAGYPIVQGPVGSISLYPSAVPLAPSPAVPEPATVLLWLLGVAGVVVAARRR